jgi:hypothetical protein
MGPFEGPNPSCAISADWIKSYQLTGPLKDWTSNQTQHSATSDHNTYITNQSDEQQVQCIVKSAFQRLFPEHV